MLGQAQVCILVAHQLNKYRDSGSQRRTSWSSAGLHPCGASAEPLCPFLFDNQIYIRLMDSELLFGSQCRTSCILVWRISRVLSSLKEGTFLLDKQIPWHPPDCFAQDSELLFGSQCRTS